MKTTFGLDLKAYYITFTAAAAALFHSVTSGFALASVVAEDVRLATHAIKISATDIISIVNYVDKIRKEPKQKKVNGSSSWSFQ